MASLKLHEAPCGNGRPNCRYLAAPKCDTRGLCQQHLAWCPDDHDPRPPWEVLVYREQRAFRTGG